MPHARWRPELDPQGMPWPARRGAAGGGRAERTQPFKGQGLGPGPYVTCLQKTLSLCLSFH